jgi:presenilin-like A22 family membrane protease
MHHTNEVMLFGLVVAGLGYAAITAWGFMLFRDGKHRTTGRAYMLLGVGDLAMVGSNAVSPTTWLRYAVFWTGFLVAMYGIVIGLVAAKRRKDDRKQALGTTTRY